MPHRVMLCCIFLQGYPDYSMQSFPLLQHPVLVSWQSSDIPYTVTCILYQCVYQVYQVPLLVVPGILEIQRLRVVTRRSYWRKSKNVLARKIQEFLLAFQPRTLSLSSGQHPKNSHMMLLSQPCGKKFMLLLMDSFMPKLFCAELKSKQVFASNNKFQIKRFRQHVTYRK